MPITSQAKLAKTNNKHAIRQELAELKGEMKKLKAATKKRKEQMEHHRRSNIEHELAVNAVSSALSKEKVPDSMEAIRKRSISFDDAAVKAKSGGGGRKRRSTGGERGGILTDSSSAGSTVGLRIGPRRSQRRRSVLKKPGYKGRKKSGDSKNKKHKKKVTLLAGPSTPSSGSEGSESKSTATADEAGQIPKGAFKKKGSLFSQIRLPTDKGGRRATIAKMLGQTSAAADKVRGRVARKIRLLRIFRFLGHTYTMIAYEFLMCLLLLIYFQVAGYVASVDKGNNVLERFLRICDLIFISDLLYRLLIQVLRHFADLDYTLLLIPCTPGFWLVHLACLFPADILVTAIGIETDNLSIIARAVILRFNRFCILGSRVWSFVDILEVEQYLSERAAFLIVFYLLYIMCISITAGVLFGYPGILAKLPLEHFFQRPGSVIEGTWIEKAYITNPGIVPNPLNNYLLSMSFSTSMVTTVGYGDPAPKNELEMVIGILAMLIGAIGIAGWFGSTFTGFLLAKDRARYELFHRADVIQQHLESLGSTALFCEKTREFYECLWNYREGVHKVEMIKLLPNSMHEDIIFDVCSEMFHKTLMFRGLDEPFLRAVSHTVEVVIYNPEMILCLQGERPNSMYYIIQGECVAKTRHSSNQTSAILRPGCVFGETSLFASYPHTVNIETRTCCQMLVIHKDRLNAVCKQYPDSWAVMRARIRVRLSKLREHFDVRGAYPIIWTSRRHDAQHGHHHSTTAQLFPEYPLTLRWADGFSWKVPPDAIEGAQLPVIVEMGCLDPEFASEEINTYGTCVIPITLTTPAAHFWHIALLSIGLPHYLAVCFESSSDVAMIQGPSADLMANVSSLDQVVAFLYVVDIFVEIFTATPSSGLIFYKFTDGLRVKSRQWSFYVDLYACLPYMDLEASVGVLHLVNNVVRIAVGRGVKIILKMGRYFDYLNETYPKRIFILRVLEAVLSLVILGHSAACALLYLACPHPRSVNTAKTPIRKCHGFNWFNSFYSRALLDGEEDIDKGITPDGIVNTNPYLLSMYFSIATWSSAGYGDFLPQNRYETLFLILMQLFGFYIIGSITARLTSALSCISLAQINFEKKLQSMKVFFQLHGFTMKLRDRITEHYKLQYAYNRGIELPPGVRHLMYDAPPYLAEDALFAEMSAHLEGVPPFSHLDPATLVHMAMQVKRYVLPPNIVFLHRGDVRREMYIVKKGSVAILKEDGEEVKALLEPTGHFGLRDLLYGEPSFNRVKTLSYCILYAVDFTSFNLVCGHDLQLMYEIEQHKGKLEERIELLNMVYKEAAKSWDMKERKPTEIPSWIVFPTQENPRMVDICTYEEFMEAYDTTCGWFFKRFLMRRTIHPAGTFALFWCLLTASMGLLFLLVFLLELLLDYTSPFTTFIINFSKMVFIIDVYVRMHWAFYTDLNHLICHPVYTAKHYLLEGPFVFGLFLEIAEYSFILFFLRAVDISWHGEGEKWDLKLQVIRLSHLFRLPIFFKFGHNVSRHRTQILLCMYVLLTLALCSVLASVSLYHACPWDQSPYDASRATKVRACLEDKWTSTKETLYDDMNVMWKRWLIGIYYISQTVLVIGYGDMVTLDRTELIQLCAMMLFGFVVTRCIIADFSAFVISEDSLRAQYLEKINRITTVMMKQEVDPKLIDIVDEHLQHTWVMCKGLQPRELLKDLHPALQSDLFKEYIGDAVTSVPLWYGLNDCVIRTLCTYMKKLYFTRGERIARKGNLEFEMYVIVDGDVWITGKQLQYRCTLGPGETFGETQMMLGIVRGYSAVAANNVEVFALNAADFAEVLEHYPGLKRDMEERLGWTQVDLFEKKVDFIQEKQFQVGKGFFAAAETRITRHIRKSVSSREIFENFENDEENAKKRKESKLKQFVKQHVYGWGSSDTNLPYFYLATSSRAKKPLFLIHPRCGFYQHFSKLVVFVSVLSAVLGMYLTIFTEGPASGPFEVARTEKYYIIFPIVFYLSDLVYLIHIFLQFFVPFPTVEGKFCKERKRICYRYTRTVTRFWVDVISTIPLQLYGRTMVSNNDGVQFVNILKSLRLINFYRSLNESYENIHVTTFRYNIISSVTSFFLMAHVLAILFYFVSHCHLGLTQFPPKVIGSHNDSVCMKGTWPAEFIENFLDGQDTKPEALRSWRWYIRSLYWVVTTISTTGFGDIVALTLPEVTISIICIFCGAFILAYILSLFTSGITSLNQHHREYLYQLQIVARYMGNLGLKAAWQSSMIEWFIHRWEISRGATFTQAIEILPLTLQTTVNLALYQQTVTKVALFRGLEPRFFRALVGFIEHVVYLPGQIIENEGNHGNLLFIVSKGRVSGYIFNRHGQPKLMRWYDEGCCFGRLPAFFYDQVYSKTYRAEVETEVLSLTKHSIFYLARYFPEFERRIQTYIQDTYDPALGTDTIFSSTLQRHSSVGFFTPRFGATLFGAGLFPGGAGPSRRNKGINTKTKKIKKLKKKHKKKRGKRETLKLLVDKEKQRKEEEFLESKAKQLIEALNKARADASATTTSEITLQLESQSSAGDENRHHHHHHHHHHHQHQRTRSIVDELDHDVDRMIQFDAKDESVKKASR